MDIKLSPLDIPHAINLVPELAFNRSMSATTYDSDDYSEDAEEFDCDEHLGTYPEHCEPGSPCNFSPSSSTPDLLMPFAADAALYSALARAADLRFISLTLEEQTVLFGSLVSRSYAPGEVVVAEGVPSRDMFFIVGGGRGGAEVEVVRGDKVVTHLRAGQYFGERFFLVRRPVARNATVRVPQSATQAVTLAVLTVDRFSLWDSFRHFLLLKKVPIFATLRLHERVSLFSHVLVREFEDGAFIVRQGEVGIEFFVVVEGSVRIVEAAPLSALEEQPRVLVTLHSGHFFGEMALLTSEPRVASAVAQGRTLCMCLDKELFRAALSNGVFNDLLNRVAADRHLARRLRRNASFGEATRKARSVSSLPSNLSVEVKRMHASSVDLSVSPPLVKRARTGTRHVEDGAEYIDRYRVVGTLGKGSQGKVVLCEDAMGGALVAVKIIPFPRVKLVWSPRHRGVQYSVAKEVEIMGALSHKNVVRLIEVVEDASSECTCVVLEHLSGALINDDDEQVAFCESACRRHFRDLVEGVAYLHDQGVVHRDIKPSNLLLSADGCLKISDFGLAAYATDTDAVRGGTPAFMAPELFDSAQSFVSRACDVFAMGATLYYLLTGRAPWSGANELLLAGNLTMFELTFPPEVEPVNPHLRHLLQRMMEKNPLDRIALADIISHDWVTAEGTQQLFASGEGAGDYASAGKA